MQETGGEVLASAEESVMREGLETSGIGRFALTAVLSYAQFTFETMALGLLTATTLHFAYLAVEDATQP